MEIKTTVEGNGEDLEKTPPPSDKMLDMAVEFGRLGARYDQTTQELMEVKANQSQTAAMLGEIMSQLQALRGQEATNGAQTEQLQESITEIKTELEQAESEQSGELIEVTPPMETHVEIDQRPAQSRGWMSKLIYGNR
jgi:uncharacterized coiled-coil DUF342 family protein